MPGHAPSWEGQSQWDWETSSQLPSAPLTPFSLWDVLSHPTLTPGGSSTSHSPAASPPQPQPPLPHSQHSGSSGLSPALLLFQEPGETQEFLGSVLAERSEQMVP